MSSSSTPAKRRRVELANSTLRKPFRSPMINRPKPDDDDAQQTGTAEPEAEAETSTPSKPGLTPTLRRPRESITSATPTKPPSAALPMRRVLPARSTFTASAARKTGNPAQHSSPADELLEQMRKTRNETSTHLREMQQRLDLVRQAKRIEEHSNARRPGEPVDAELRELMEKWKMASRQAAEDVFELIKVRVEGMGGGKAWRESRRRRREGFRGFDEEEGGRKGEVEEREEFREDYGGGDGDGEEGESGKEGEEGDDEGFTMVMMFKSLNIDPDVLGYDAAEDKWRE
ncbi:hypothetical protein B0T19DRAFT_437217 [Cercophora scortea]|uniref:Swi5-dependent recombination DNA repair protein 1 n=1 Tax=Cercophora scortea TaxID=314031 RepID=A0AAE0MLF0_9PEZI|nr:hypothetical protein B0T19DRAFT_437217 [Cercophora scortea]